MRINKMITKRKIFDLSSNSLNWFYKEMYKDQSGEFVCGYWGLKGWKSVKVGDERSTFAVPSSMMLVWKITEFDLCVQN